MHPCGIPQTLGAILGAEDGAAIVRGGGDGGEPGYSPGIASSSSSSSSLTSASKGLRYMLAFLSLVSPALGLSVDVRVAASLLAEEPP
jgi:hypothetical protein